MPQVSITEENASGGGVEPFDYLDLDTGEVARLAILDDTAAHYEWVHELKERVTDNGVVQKEWKTRANKSQYQDYATNFVGRGICLGDDEYMRGDGRGLDTRRCPACKASVDLGIPDLAPQRRYALPVIRLETVSKKDSDIREDPPGAKMYVLKLTSKQWDTLIGQRKGIRNLWDLPRDKEVFFRYADIILVCEDGNFRRFTYQAPARPAWAKKKNPALHAMVTALWANVKNRPTIEQLTIACGRVVDYSFLAQDVERVADSYAEVKAIEERERNGGRSAAAETATPGAANASLAEGLDELDELVNGPGEPAVPDDDLGGLGEFMSGDQKTAARSNGSARSSSAPPADDVFGGADLPDGPAVSADEEELFTEPSGPPAQAAKPAAAKPRQARPAAAKTADLPDDLPAPDDASYKDILDEIENI